MFISFAEKSFLYLATPQGFLLCLLSLGPEDAEAVLSASSRAEAYSSCHNPAVADCPARDCLHQESCLVILELVDQVKVWGHGCLALALMTTENISLWGWAHCDLENTQGLLVFTSKSLLSRAEATLGEPHGLVTKIEHLDKAPTFITFEAQQLCLALSWNIQDPQLYWKSSCPQNMTFTALSLCLDHYFLLSSTQGHKSNILSSLYLPGLLTLYSVIRFSFLWPEDLPHGRTRHSLLICLLCLNQGLPGVRIGPLLVCLQFRTQ